MYYEVHGRREGGRRRVIALEEQAHGRTTDRNTPVAFESSADDVAALLRYLKVDKADILGFSNGASIALQVAIRHPHLVRKMVFASSITKRTSAALPQGQGLSRARPAWSCPNIASSAPLIAPTATVTGQAGVPV
jgi:pimeloyl-ACP methyl ester carboxylesterase